MQLILKRYVVLGVLLLFLLCSVIFGGAGREGRFAHSILQAFSALGIAVFAVSWPIDQKLKPLRTPLSIIFVLVAIALLHSVPLPERVWQSLPGRGLLIDGFHSLGVPRGPMPLSLDVEATLSTIGYALPPVFVMLLCLKVGLRRLKSAIPWFMLVISVASVALGAFQIILGNDDRLYFYEITNVDLPVGTFANVNHFANFILLSMPFTVFLLREASKNWQKHDHEIALVVAVCGALLLLGAGIAAAGSLAVYLMTLPVGGAAFLAGRKQGTAQSNIYIQGGLAAALVVMVAAVATSPLLYGLGSVDLSDGHLSRINIWSMTIEAVRDHWPVGSGIGTYPAIIPLYEDPTTVTSTYIARAHNEYLQLLMEAGVLGLIVLIFALSWLGVRTWKIWTSQSERSDIAFKKIATISILVVVLHSLVDFPLRTPAITAFFAMFIAIIAMNSRDHIAQTREEKTNPKRVVL